MTPNEKAEELVLQFYEVVKNKYPSINGIPLAKQCALIAVDEVLNFIHTDAFSYTNEEYWQEVKQEIEKL